MPIDWKRIANTAKLGGNRELESASRMFNTGINQLKTIPEQYNKKNLNNTLAEQSANTGAYMNDISLARNDDELSKIKDGFSGYYDATILAGALDNQNKNIFDEYTIKQKLKDMNGKLKLNQDKFGFDKKMRNKEFELKKSNSSQIKYFIGLRSS